jgi:hypothetical protein
MLAGTSVPQGSSVSSTEPSGDGGLLGTASRTYDTPVLVDLHHFYVEPGSAASDMEWMSQHLPSGSSLDYEGTNSKGELVLVFAWPTSGPVFNDQVVLVNAVSLSGGLTGVRVDADVVWLPVKPLGDLISGAKVVDLQRTLPGSTSVQRVVVSNPHEIANLLARFNQLRLVPPGAHTCPKDKGPTIRFEFKHRAGASPFATVIAVGTGCRYVQVQQFGKWIVPELLGYNFVFVAGDAVGIGYW